MLCDRALLGAYATQKQTVSAAIVKRAMQELQGEQVLPKKRATRLTWLLLSLFILVAVVWFYRTPITTALLTNENPATAAITTTIKIAENQPKVEEITAPDIRNDEPLSTEETSDIITAIVPDVNIDDWLMDQHNAFNQLLNLWGTPNLALSNQHPCDSVINLKLNSQHAKGTWNNIRHNQRPAMLKLKSNSASHYALIVGLDAQNVKLKMASEEVSIPIAQLEPYWFGDFILLWQPPPSGQTLINSQSPDEAVQWIEQQLIASGYADEGQALAQKIKTFQQDQGLEADGIAGPNTLIHLNTSAGDQNIPRLEEER